MTMLNATQSAPNMAVQEIRELSKIVNELEGAFRAHQQTLVKMGQRLPQGTLPGLQQLHTDLNGLAKQIEDTQTELQRLRELGDTTELINSTLDLSDVLNSVMDSVIKLTRAERGYLVLRNPATGKMDFRVARNIERRTLEEGELIVSGSIVKEVADTGKPVVTTNAANEDKWKAQESVVGFALRSILCVPLTLKGEVTGVIYADNRIKEGLFGPKELQLLYAFANQAAVAIENARLYQELQRSLAEITAIKDLMANVFASIASGVITADATDTIMILNDAASRILNIHPERSLGQQIWNVLPPLHQGFDRLLQEVRERNLVETVEAEPEIPPRGVVNLNLKLSPLRDDTQVTQGVTIVVDDLTELKQREAQLAVIRRYLPPALVDTIHSIDALGLGGERREVTTAFIDVRAFNSFPPSLRPQELMETLNVYLTIASDAVTQQSGVIDKYMANEIMGLFNTQLNPIDDHAVRAVVAALNMADEYVDFYRLAGEREGVLHYRAGIHTGVATLGNTGSETRKEFTAIGDSINLAHRLLENAEPGQIIISEDTFHQCQAYLSDPKNGIRVTPLDQIQVKGKRQPVKIYQVSRAQVPVQLS
jgi:PAS domain S-box-containing protein